MSLKKTEKHFVKKTSAMKNVLNKALILFTYKIVSLRNLNCSYIKKNAFFLIQFVGLRLLILVIGSRSKHASYQRLVLFADASKYDMKHKVFS